MRSACLLLALALQDGSGEVRLLVRADDLGGSYLDLPAEK
jgi:hypothetical protein